MLSEVCIEKWNSDLFFTLFKKSTEVIQRDIRTFKIGMGIYKF